MEKVRKQARSSNAAYRQIYYWNYQFNEVLGSKIGEDLNVKTVISKMTIWLGKLYDVAAQSTFQAYYQQLLNIKQMKIFFAACMILHTVRFMRYLQENYQSFWKQHRGQIIRNYDKNSTLALEFLMTKFPQKQVGSIDPDLNKLIPVVDRTQDPNIQILKCINIKFTGENTLQQIKHMMNTLISTSKQKLVSFRKQMTEIFTLKEGDQQVLLYNVIGMKFRDTMEQFSQNQMKQLGIKIKGPQMLRIMIKWIEQLQKKCKDVDKYIINRYYPFNTKKKDLKKLNYKQKDELAVRIKQIFQQVKQADQKNADQIASILFDLFKFISFQKENFKYIQEKQVTVGLFTHILSESISNIISEYLELLINKICEASQDIDFITFNVSDLLRCKCSGTKKQIKAVYQKLDKKFTIVRVKNRLKTSNNDYLINFKYQGLTCECQLGFTMDKKQQNKKAYYQNSFSHFLYEMARSKFSPLTEIVIINNHLNQTIGFFQQILKKKNKKVTDANTQQQNNEQSTASQRTTEQIMTQNFTTSNANRQKYMIQDEKPTTSKMNMQKSFPQKLIISYKNSNEKISTQQDTNKKSIIQKPKKLKDQIKVTIDKNIINIQGYNAVKNTYPLFCNFCWEYKGAYQSFLDMYVSIAQKKNICGQCYMSCLKPTQITSYLLGERLANFFQKSTLAKLLQLQDFKEYYVILLYKSYNKNINVFCKPKGIQQFCPVFSKYKGKYEFSSPSELKQRSLFAFTIKNQLKFSKQFKQILQSYNQIGFIQPQITFQKINNNREELIFVQTSTETLILNNQNTQQIKRERYKQLKFKTLVDKNWWLMESENIDQNFFDNPQIIKYLTKVIKLEISDNNLKDIKFLNRNSLVHLNVSNNNIIEIDFLDLDFTGLKHLDFSRNIITHLKLTDCNLNELEVLIATSNKIKQCYLENAGLKSLKEFRINNNRLENIYGFNNLQFESLQMLRLEENLLSDLRFLIKGEKITNMKRLLKLKQLSFQNNKIKNFEGFIEAEIQALQQISFGSPDIIQLKNWNKCKLHFLKTIQIKNSKKIQGIRSFTKFFALKKIIIKQNILTTIDLSDLNLKYLENLSVTENSLQKIQGLKRATLNSLKVLDFTKNSIKTFDFANITLPELTHLHLQSNYINSLQNIKSSNLPKLHELHLENNRVQQFNLADIPFAELSLINLSNNRLKRIMGTQLKMQSLRNLTTLHLQKNQLELFQFPNLVNLQRIFLQQNSLQFLKILNKDHCSYLVQLRLNKNKLRQFDFKDISLPSLKILDLSQNKIGSISFAQSVKISSLTQLLLFDNKLQTIDFVNLSSSKLKLIDISFNNLFEVKGLMKNKSGSKFSQLEKFNLRNNKIKMFDFEKLDLPMLRELYLQNNQISPAINFKGAKLQNLTKLNLQKNSIQQVSFLQSKFPKLVQINLKNNKIVKIQNLGEAKLQNLNKIYLDNNQLNTFSLRNIVLQKLQSLDLTNNKLVSIEGLESAKLPNLKRISLFQIQGNRSYLKLELINIESNRLAQFSLQSSQFPQLKKIILKQNNLQSISNMFEQAKLPKLQVLLLNKNQIKIVNFSQMKQLRLSEINLDENDIGKMIFQKDCLKFLKKLHISANSAKMNINISGVQLVKLQSLFINNNKQLSSISGFENAKLDQLIELHLQGNQLVQIPFKNITFNKLQNMNFIKNKIATLQNLQQMTIPNIKYLRFSNNSIVSVSFRHFTFNTLIRLDLDNNKINDVSNLQKAKLPYLQILNLRSNHIKIIDFKNVFMYSLKHLILADNSLSMLTGFTQAKFPNLVSLDLCNNKLSQLDINSDLAMSHLQKLMLHNNNLSQLYGVDDRLKMLNIVTLNNNPIDSDSRYQWIRQKYSNPIFERSQ